MKAARHITNIPSVTINDIKGILRINSPSDDFIILNNLTDLPNFTHLQKIKGLILTVCTKGEIEVRINSKKALIREKQFFICLPDLPIQFLRNSKEFSAKTIILSDSFVEKMKVPTNRLLPLLLCGIENPCFILDMEEIDVYLEYFDFIEKRIVKMKKSPFQREVIYYTLKSLFFEGNHVSQKRMEMGDMAKTKKELLFETFLKLVNLNYKKYRSIGFYADKLKLTPKYLSATIKEVSGISAGQWIDDLVIKEAKTLLESKFMSVQQVSDELNFANQSFFGKYFKQHTGFSPSVYKKMNGLH